MRKLYSIIFLSLISFPAFADTLLPNPLPVYINGDIKVLEPIKGSTKTLLPIDNTYTADPGCYIVCYSHDKNNSVYAVSSNTFVVGQIRVPGNRQGDQCVPLHYENQVVSSIQTFKDLCNNTFAAACTTKDCWGGSNSW